MQEIWEIYGRYNCYHPLQHVASSSNGFLQPRVRFRIRLSLRKNAKILAGYSTVSSSNAERNSGYCGENLRGQCYQVGARALALTFGNTKRTTMISTIQTTALKHLAPYRDKITVCNNFTSDCARTVPDDSLDFIYIDARHDLKGVAMAQAEMRWHICGTRLCHPRRWTYTIRSRLDGKLRRDAR